MVCKEIIQTYSEKHTKRTGYSVRGNIQSITFKLVANIVFTTLLTG